MLRLAIRLPGGREETRSFLQGPVLVGRSPEANLILPEPSISRRHALFDLSPEGWWVEDLGSRNGTTVDGERVQGKKLLRAGQKVRLGQVELVVRECGVHPEVAEGGAAEATLLTPVRKVMEDSGVNGMPVSPDAPPQQVHRVAQRFSLLARLHEQLASQVNEEGLLTTILEQAFEQLGPDQAAIFLQQENGEFICAASRCQQDCYDKLLLSRSLVREVVDKKAAALVLDATTDARFHQAQSLRALGVRSLLAVPLVCEEQVLGLLVCASRLAVRRFTQEDLEFLVPLAAVAAIRLRNLRLAADAAERKRLEQELALARRIQVGLFREETPTLDGYQVLGGNVPSRVVSGDFYQVLQAPLGCILLLADVSGKGMGAALLAASLEALFAGPLSQALPPAEVCQKVSSLFFTRTEANKFATGILAYLETATGCLTYANAGHCPGLLVRASGEVVTLDPTGPPLGLFPQQRYGQHQQGLTPGDLVLLYSDGVSETASPEGEEFGAQRLTQLVQAHRHRSLEELMELLETELDRFARTPLPADDRTLVLLRRHR